MTPTLSPSTSDAPEAAHVNVLERAGTAGEIETEASVGAVLATVTAPLDMAAPDAAPSLGVTLHTTRSPRLNHVPPRVLDVAAIAVPLTVQA